MRKISLLLSLGIALWAKPSGFQSPQAVLQEINGEMCVQSGKQAFVQWDSFSLSKEELIRFVQQDSGSWVINQVMGNERSSILGAICSNGQVVLINPNGILIGESARIDTAGFMASTLDLVDSDLNENRLHFKGESREAVVNQGVISSPFGDVFLIGRRVENEGEIIAGRHGFLAGNDVVIRPEGAKLVWIENAEVFDADNPYASAISHSGKVKAKDSVFYGDLIEISGSVDASGENGGTVVIKANEWTGFSGSIVARGKRGGFAEVSGKHLSFTGMVDLSGEVFGTLLLDPTNITISTSADGGGSFGGCTYSPSGTGPDNINTTTLQNLLGSCSVTISTVGSTGVGTGTIAINNNVTWSAATTLTLDAAAAITVSAAVTNTSATTGFDAVNFTAATGGISIPSGSSIITTGGDIVLVSESGTLSFAASTMTSSTGNIYLSGNSGVSFNGLSIGSTTSITTGGSIFANFTGSNNGIVTSGSPFIETTGGADQIIEMIGTSSSATTGSGILWLAQITAQALNGASIHLTGTTSGSTTGNGISFQVTTGTGIETSTGDIVISGTTVGSTGHGINMISSVTSTFVSASGNITLNGSASSSSGTSHGVRINTAWDAVTTGIVSVTGTSPFGLPIAVNANVTSGGLLQFNSLVGLLANAQFTAGSLSFTSISGNFNPTLSASGAIAVSGNVNLTGAGAGAALSATGGSISIDGSVTTSGTTNGAGGSVSLSSTGGNITVHDITASGGSSSGNGGNITIAPVSTLVGGIPVGLIVLGGNLVSLAPGGTGGTILLSASRSAYSTVATITSSLAGNDIAMSAATITMGTYEALTGFGNVALTATTMTVGDLVALNNITLNATTINLNLHGNISLLSSGGELYTSPSVHFIAGGSVSASGALTPSGPIRIDGFGGAGASFEEFLLFGSQILNYDLGIPVFSLNVRQYLMYWLSVADAQFYDQLPLNLCRVAAFYDLKKDCRR